MLMKEPMKLMYNLHGGPWDVVTTKTGVLILLLIGVNPVRPARFQVGLYT